MRSRGGRTIAGGLAALLFFSSAGLAANPLQELLQEARRHVGSSYCRGGISPPCFDCSGFVYYLLHEQIEGLPRTSRQMARFGAPLSRDELQPGDLLFFATTSRRGVISHVALFLGQESIIHAISAGPNRGVHITPVNARYWREHYHSAARVVPAALRDGEGSETPSGQAAETETAAEPIRFAKGRYTGELRNGQPHGTGRLEFDNGDLYRGQFREGQMHGRGTYLWADGARYEGQFRQGEMHGSGVYVTADGRRVSGTWSNGELAEKELPDEPRKTYSRVHDSPWDEWDGYMQGDFYAWQREQEEDFEAWKERNSEY